MLHLLLDFDASSLIDRFFHPLGDLGLVRYVIAAAVAVVFAAYPLLYRKRYRQADEEAQESVSVSGGSGFNSLKPGITPLMAFTDVRFVMLVIPTLALLAGGLWKIGSSVGWLLLIAGGLFGAVTLYGLRSLRREYRTRAASSAGSGGGMFDGSGGSSQPKLGVSWIVLGVLGLALLGVLLLTPYTYLDLEWKTFSPLARGSNRMITFLAVIPLVLLLAFGSYWVIKRPTPKPVKFVLASLRTLALMLVFVLLCMPFLTEESKIEKPYRSLVLLDDSLSMGDVTRGEFPVLVALKAASNVDLAPIENAPPEEVIVVVELLGEEIPAKVRGAAVAARNLRAELALAESGEVDAIRRKLDDLELILNATLAELRLPGESTSEMLMRMDAQAARDAEQAIADLGVRDTRTIETYEVSDLSLVEFRLRAFVRNLMSRRAERLDAKLRLLHGRGIDLDLWVKTQVKIDVELAKLKNNKDEISAESQSLKPSEARLTILREERDKIESQLAALQRNFDEMISKGPVFAAIPGSMQGASQSAIKKRQQRLRDAITGVATNLLSSTDPRGPTRWDIACELMQPGNDQTVQAQRGVSLISLAARPASGRLTLLDLMRRNGTRQPEYLPSDLAEMAQAAEVEGVQERPQDSGLTSPFTLYTFSDTQAEFGGNAILRETAVEELDFRRPAGRTTHVFTAHNAVLSSEVIGEVSSILLISDGHDTKPQGAVQEAQRAAELQRAMLTQEEAPRVLVLAVGNPKPDRVLALRAVSGDTEVVKGESAEIALDVRANATWDVEVVLCKDSPNNEIKYESLDGEVGRTRFTIEESGDGEIRTKEVRLRFNPLESGRYILKLNRERQPDEDTYENNIGEIRITVIDRRVRVLLLDERFRYETRYIQNAMARDRTLEFQSFIWDADLPWRQRSSEWPPVGGEQPVGYRVPALQSPFAKTVNKGTPDAYTVPASSYEDWDKPDVVIIGDISPTNFLPKHLDWLNRFVNKDEGGVIWIAGQNHNPQAYASLTQLDQIIPVRVGKGYRAESTASRAPYYYGLTPQGFSHEIFRFSDSAERRRELWGEVDRKKVFRPGQLDGYYWYAPVEGPKDIVSAVLARVAKPGEEFIFGGQGAPTSLIVTREYESGRSLFVGTDEIWRFRRYFADFFAYRFWQNAVRWAATNRLKKKKEGIDLYTNEEAYVLGETVEIGLDLLGNPEQYQNLRALQEAEAQEAIERDPTLKDKVFLLVKWRNADFEGGTGSRSRESGTLVLRNVPGRADQFEGFTLPNEVGKYELNVIGEPITTKNPTIFFVRPSSEQNVELRETEVKAKLLESLASPVNPPEIQRGEDADDEGSSIAEVIRESEGRDERYFNWFYEVAEIRPDLRTKTITGDVRDLNLFDLLELLVAICVLLGMEWAIRKMVRLA